MPLFNKGLRPDERSLLLRQLAMLAANGISLSDGIHQLARSNESTAVRSYCQALIDESASPTAKATSDPDVGPDMGPNIGSMIARLAKKAGDPEVLAESLYEMADVNDTTATYRSSLISALIYPIKILIVAILIWSIILIFVIPVFEEVFAGFHSVLPGPTLLILDISQWVRDFFPYLALLLGGLLLLLVLDHRSQRVLLRLIPSLKRLVLNGTLIDFSHLLPILLNCGFSLPEALHLAVGSISKTAYSYKLAPLGTHVQNVTELKEALKQTGIFPQSLVALTDLADRPEKLPPLFTHFSKYLCKGFDGQLTRAYKTLELTAFITTAIVVGVMAVAMYLPIFKMAGAIG